MASPQGPSTRPATTPPPPSSASAGDGLDLTTLFLSAVASAVSAFVTSKIWAPGALWAAAMSPVIVALVKEALRKPTDLVTSAVPSRRGLRGSGRAAPLPDDLPALLDAGAPAPFPPPVAGAPDGPVRIYSTRGRMLRWRLALVTGLLGFLVCVLVYTVPEVLAGRSVVQSGHKTTLWGGTRHHHRGTTTTVTTTTRPAPKVTTTTPRSGAPARTVTAPARTVTVAPPAATQPPPATTTPAPEGAGGSATTPQLAPDAGGQTTTPGG